MNDAGSSMFMTYNRKSGLFTYDRTVQERFAAVFDKRPFWQIITEDNLGKAEDAIQLKNVFESMLRSDKPQVKFFNTALLSRDNQYYNYTLGIVNTEKSSDITITLTCGGSSDTSTFKPAADDSTDELTGLLRRSSFTKKINLYLDALTPKDMGKYMLVYFDIQRFKVINDIFGLAEGDKLLVFISKTISKTVKENGCCCRLGSDRFALFTKIGDEGSDTQVNRLLDIISTYPLSFEVNCNAGIYVVNEGGLSAGSVIDRAIIAQSAIKGSYTQRFMYYAESMRKDLLTEQELTGMMRSAIKDEQFLVYYQPQYNHSTGLIVGAEALVRWLHPEKGLIPPGNFIPIFEKNGFITELDLYVFDKVCRFIKHCLENGIPVVPISTNLTRYDIFSPGFMERLDEIRKRYDIPPKYIRVEITESAALGNSDFINSAVRKLHSYGFVVEMDDFGSGYSSLNILKDIEFDIIKLDMKFLQSDNDKFERGSRIINSVVRMVNWLGLPLIAEGVETKKQADYLLSMGCELIQGYLYSKPLPEENYINLIKTTFNKQPEVRAAFAAENKADDPLFYRSLENLVFSKFVGGAILFSYYNGKIEFLRVNKQYIDELGINMTEKQFIMTEAFSTIDAENKKIYTNMLDRAIETGLEQECETWRTYVSDCCGKETVCVRTTAHLVAHTRYGGLFYATVRNITKEKTAYTELLKDRQRVRAACEQANIYYWEYTIATKEMRPCFRCMRDLGLPALLKNYPDSAIEMGIFPPEVADMYRDWHRQIAAGVPKLEAIIPLTVGRIPFHVRYTTMFDDNGRPVKAFGSATLVVDEDDDKDDKDEKSKK